MNKGEAERDRGKDTDRSPQNRGKSDRYEKRKEATVFYIWE